MGTIPVGVGPNIGQQLLPFVQNGVGVVELFIHFHPLLALPVKIRCPFILHILVFGVPLKFPLIFIVRGKVFIKTDVLFQLFFSRLPGQ